ncbi:MAG: 3-keto-5-aminohexanoate cleavage protein [Rhizomicrobium sp.]
MKQTKKVIITCAVTGSVHTPTMSPYLPITPAQIAEQSVAAAQAGAAIIHLHAREDDGRPSPSPERFLEFLPRIKQQTDAVMNITTGGSMGMTLDERLAAPLRVSPELSSLNMGTMNFGMFGMADKYKDWKHAWEKPFLESTRSRPAMNTFEQIEGIATRLGGDCGTRFEMECYDVGHLYVVAHFAERGIIKPPFFVQCIFGILGGIGADIDNLVHMRAVADRLLGDDYYMSVLAAGRHQLNLGVCGIAMGANIRVGLEDGLMIGPGRLATSNAEQVAKARRMIEELSLEVATPDEARSMLALKGGDQVAF